MACCSSVTSSTVTPTASGPRTVTQRRGTTRMRALRVASTAPPSPPPQTDSSRRTAFVRATPRRVPVHTGPEPPPTGEGPLRRRHGPCGFVCGHHHVRQAKGRWIVVRRDGGLVARAAAAQLRPGLRRAHEQHTANAGRRIPRVHRCGMALARRKAPPRGVHSVCGGVGGGEA